MSRPLLLGLGAVVVAILGVMLLRPTPQVGGVPSCLLDTSAQRAVWDRMKAENSVGYQQIKANTVADRYADVGRWETVAAVIDKDQTLAVKAFEEIKASTQTWTWVFDGNESRERASELVIQYGCLHAYLTDPQRNEFRAYLIAVAEQMIKGIRPLDSDQSSSNYFTLALTDKLLGTRYLDGTFTDPGAAASLNPFPVGALDAPDTINGKPTLRGQVRRFFTEFGEGGGWPESSDYNIGTTWLALMAAYYTGLESFPEATPWLVDRTQTLLFDLTPDLKDSHQWGDVQNVRILRLAVDYAPLWAMWQGVLDAVGETSLAAKLRQLEVDTYAANTITAISPIYARYYYTHNPYGAKEPWRTNGLVLTTGTGHALWREGTTFGQVHCPNWQVGAVDHFQAFGSCDLRVWKDGQWVIDHPIGYQPDQRFMNQVLTNGSGPGQEVGGLIASTYLPGKVVYVAGTQAGATPLVWEGFNTQVGTDGTVPYTTTHENTASFVQLLDGPDLTVIVANRVQADDATQETVTNQWGTFDWIQLYPYSTQRDVITNRLGIIDWVWHTNTKPTITPTGFSADGVTVTRLLPAQVTTTVVNEALDQNDPAAVPHGYCNNSAPKAGCLGGYMQPTERKFAVHEVPTTHQAFRMFLHVVSTGAVTATRMAAPPDGDWVRVSRPGLPDVAVFFSSKVGPRLTTTVAKTADLVSFDDAARKFETVTQGRIVTAKATPPAGTVAYYADMGDTLIPADTPPPPTCTFSNITPTTATVPPAGGTVPIAVTRSDPDCVVPATTDVAWIVPAPSATGLTLTVAPHTATAARVGTVTVATTTTVVITQGPVVPPPTTGCVDGTTVYPVGTERTVPAAGDALEATVDGYQDAGWFVTGILPTGPNYTLRLLCVGS